MDEKKYPDKYVVVLEIPSTGYMDCVAICGTATEAYGEAYLQLSDGEIDGEELAISMPQEREGENGFMLYLQNTKTKEIEQIATVLFYRKEERK